MYTHLKISYYNNELKKMANGWQKLVCRSGRFAVSVAVFVKVLGMTNS